MWVILQLLVGTADGPRSIQAMLCVNKHWNVVISHEIFRNNEDASRLRREYAQAFLMKLHLAFSGTSLMLRAPRGMVRAFRFHHLPRLVAPTKLQLQITNYDKDLTVAQRAHLLSLVSRAMAILNPCWGHTRVDAYGNAWFTAGKQVPQMNNSKSFRAGKKHSVTFVPTSSASRNVDGKMTSYVHGKRSLGRFRRRPVL